ncbi:DUF4097 family beta strand repeat-containing protein [Actinoplanes sp. NBRC 101535]|uniref:DUF4097 family beta strand repeat-containing protein n=1 Tax=Actinoplanes sp. NBRC 101535 TaxID=3032196 RepID=UPI0024A17B8D|nr:DUF4097 family beta strand repeat-containing protein [Actinoplanes sp. NBRC 101535]GLY06979.1 hypothetical protein Acsp01_73580 [Actinoplanes sp. NBRC 101535]
MQTFATPAPVAAVFGIPAGRVQIIAAERADTVVDVRPADAGKSRDVRAAERIQVTFHEGVLRVAAAEPANRFLGSSGSVEVTVQLPAGSRVEATTAAADVRGVGRLGDVTVDVAQGTVKFDETAAARLTLQAGDITVGRLGGPAEISTQKGHLRIDEAVTGAVTLSTQQGDITVGTAPETSATLDAGTAYGRVHNGLRNTVGASAALTIRATTAHGDITARTR